MKERDGKRKGLSRWLLGSRFKVISMNLEYPMPEPWPHPYGELLFPHAGDIMGTRGRGDGNVFSWADAK
jgi:hypothetical protein